MKSPHLLRAAANARQLKQNLVTVVDAAAIGAIEEERNWEEPWDADESAVLVSRAKRPGAR